MSVVDFSPTDEQRHALDLFSTGDSLAIEAGAGTGKTSTLLLLADAMSGKRGQYVSFNKAIAVEAGGKFPAHVACSTAHSLAMRSVGRQYAHRLNGARMTSPQIARQLDVDPLVLTVDGERRTLAAGFLAGHVMRAVERFCQSADTEVQLRHFPYLDGIDVERGWTNNDAVRRELLPAARAAWRDLLNPDGRLPYSHSHYLKAWHLSGPVIPSDVVFFDEAQDANPVLLDVVAQQSDHAQLVWVGDTQQQIYEFTGAVNALARVDSDARAFLTQSFRFGPAIADRANEVLSMLDAELRLTGTSSIDSRLDTLDEPDAVLCRTNAAAVSTVLRAQRHGQRVHLIGGSGEVTRFARAVVDLQQRGSTSHPELACFASWGEVRHYVENDPLGSELRLMVNLCDEFSPETIIAALDRMIPERDAQLVVSTAHKSKGREWGRVQLGSDFPDPDKREPSDAELRLLYVAATRAQLVLDDSAVALLQPPAQHEPPVTVESDVA